METGEKTSAETQQQRGSQRQYALHRKRLGLSGGSHVGVGKAIKDGRITLDPDGKINFARADREWEANTKPKAKPEPAKQPTEAAAIADIAHHLQSAGAGQLDELAALAARYSMPQLAKYEKFLVIADRFIRLEALGQTLIAKETVERAHTDLAKKARNSLLTLPERLAPLLIGLSDQHEIRQILKRGALEVAENLHVLRLEGEPPQDAAA